MRGNNSAKCLLPNFILSSFKITEKISIEGQTVNAIDRCPKIPFVFATEFNLSFKIPNFLSISIHFIY